MSVVLSGPPEATRGSRVDVGLLKTRAKSILRAVGQPRSELSVALVDDVEIAALNERWRGVPRATDVLSFSLLEGEFAGHRGRLLGDVVISVETAARQAEQRHRALDEIIVRLLIHGVLHLLGHDHEHDEEARRMLAEERRVWRSLA